ncbi:TPA: hypothetical protein ACH3X1_000001 [Trebouxia sp. C0004]
MCDAVLPCLSIEKVCHTCHATNKAASLTSCVSPPGSSSSLQQQGMKQEAMACNSMQPGSMS